MIKGVFVIAQKLRAERRNAPLTNSQLLKLCFLSVKDLDPDDKDILFLPYLSPVFEAMNEFYMTANKLTLTPPLGRQLANNLFKFVPIKEEDIQFVSNLSSKIAMNRIAMESFPYIFNFIPSNLGYSEKIDDLQNTLANFVKSHLHDDLMRVFADQNIIMFTSLLEKAVRDTADKILSE